MILLKHLINVILLIMCDIYRVSFKIFYLLVALCQEYYFLCTLFNQNHFKYVRYCNQSQSYHS